MKNNINKIIEAVKTKRYIHYIIIAIVGMLVCIPFFWVQIKLSDDGKFHLLRLIGLDYSTEYGSFPFLVFPFFCKDWGYSMTAFYPPIVTYVPYILGIIAGTFMRGLKVFATLTTVLSGIFMYNCINEITKKKGIALFSAILYIIFPYRIECLFNRYAIGEFTAFVFIPIVFQGLYNLLHGDKKRHYYIAIGAAGLLLTHTISTIYTAFFCLIYVLFNLKAFFNKDVIKKCVINVIFILLIAAMFLIPMLEFKLTTDYAILQPDIMKTDAKSVSTKGIEAWQFLKDKGEENGVSFIVGIPFITMLLLGILVYSKIDKEYKDIYIINIILGLIAVFMCTIYFPWRIMPDFMCTLQYPWRLLGFAYFFLVPVCAMNVYYLLKDIQKTWLKRLLYFVAIAIIAAFTIMELNQYPVDDTSQDAKYEQSIYNNPKIHYYSINRDNMPVKALYKQRDYCYNREDNTVILSGNADILSETKEAFYMEIELQNGEKGAELELPFLFYPGYRIILEENGEQTELEYTESENGFIQITLEKDIQNGKIITDYTATTLEKAAYIISGISIMLFCIYIVWYRRKCKKNKEEINEKQDKN